MQPISKIGEISARFEEIRILHPAVERLFELCDKLRQRKQNTRERAEQCGGMVFAESHAGKSTGIQMYLETTVVDECYARGLFPKTMGREDVLKAQTLVIYVSLSPDATMGSLFGDLLEALGDPNPHQGTIPARRRRAYHIMRALKVELLIFDEIDHLKTPVQIGVANREKAMSVHNQLKKFMKDGFPVLFVGVPEAQEKLFSEKQIKGIVMYSVDFDVLDPKSKECLELYREYVGNMGMSIFEKGLAKEPIILVSKNIYIPLLEACGGLRGYTTRFLVHACEKAFVEGVQLERRHLVETADFYTPFLKKSDNPFRAYDRRKRLKEAADGGEVADAA